MKKNSRLCERALDYAERGFYVFPCRSRAKKPLTARGFKDATRKELEILAWWERWPDANIGIACGASGIVVLDIDPKHGADPAELIPALGLEHHPATVLTGNAPAVSDKHLHSLEGVRGAQLHFRGKHGTQNNLTIAGELRGVGAYVLAPSSVHPCGIEYAGNLPPVADLPELPRAVLDLVVRPEGTTAGPVEGKIPFGSQHNTLVSFAGSMWNRGMTAEAIAAALKTENRVRCQMPGSDAEMDKIARSMRKYAPGKAPWKFNGAAPVANDDIFIAVQGDPEAIRPPRFAWEGRILLGAWNALVGAGQAGKGVLIAWLAAGWSRGVIPGEFEGQPIDVLIVADEDSRHDTWDPRIMAAGGDLSRVHYLAYAPGTTAEQRSPFEFNRHVARLEHLMVEAGCQGVYFDSVFDHFSADSNGNLPMDVRKQLAQVRSMLREIDRFGVYSCHPNKGHGKSLRDLVGGSHQLVEVARCGLFLGYHPDDDGVRVLVRAKGNVGVPPPGLRFGVESNWATNTRTGQAVDVGRIASVEVDPDGLTLRDLSVDPISGRGDGPSREEQAQAVIVEIAADGEWHPRSEAEEACADIGHAGGTFKRAFVKAPIVTHRDEAGRGRPITYRLKRKDDG